MKDYLALLLPIPLIPQIPSPVEVGILCLFFGLVYYFIKILV